MGSVCTCTCMPRCTCGRQKAACRNRFSPALKSWSRSTRQALAKRASCRPRKWYFNTECFSSSIYSRGASVLHLWSPQPGVSPGISLMAVFYWLLDKLKCNKICMDLSLDRAHVRKQDLESRDLINILRPELPATWLEHFWPAQP